MAGIKSVPVAEIPSTFGTKYIGEPAFPSTPKTARETIPSPI